MVPAGTMILSPDAQALKLEQGILGPASPIPSPCLLLKNMFNPSECAPYLPRYSVWLSLQGFVGCHLAALQLRCRASACLAQGLRSCLTRRETEPNWDEDIEKDVKEECSKYGAVNHAHVDKNSKVRAGPGIRCRQALYVLCITPCL